MIRLKKGTFVEIGKHFLALALVSLSIGLLTPLFQNKLKLDLSIAAVIGVWFFLFIIGIYFINRGQDDG